MKRLLFVLFAVLLLAALFPPLTAGRDGDDGDDGFDPCEACIYVPAWCGICLIEQWWDTGDDCFPWWPECY